MGNKRGLAMEELVWWIIGIAVLVVMVGVYLILKDKGSASVSLLDRIRSFGA